MTSNLFVPLCIIVYLFILDWRMALASLVTLPIGFLCYMGMSRGYSERFSGLMKRVQKMNATIIEYVGGIEVIKAFNQSANSYQKYSDAVNDDARYAVDWMKEEVYKRQILFLAFALVMFNILSDILRRILQRDASAREEARL